ncbi:protein SDA1 homolog isoform X2 [Gossypium hirsutum]|uniref:Protein SDA1 n=1 Tax=Gossypium hirsutum TaxID=3635 RepID=A0ABM2ZC68_GOSHI|nr:protein SDA1 homolog isoform X2 [Gossypium hirsutum]
MVSMVSGSAEPLSASGRSSEKLSLPSLQSKMKTDPEGYETELHLIRNQFYSALELFQQQAALNFSSISGVGADPTVAKDLSDRAMFLAHVTPFYPKQLAEFPSDLAAFLKSSARTLPSGLRFHATQAVILLVNRKTLDDRNLRKLAFSHVVHSIRRMNKNHKNEAKNRSLQNILFGLLQQDDEAKAKRSLITLCELHRRKVWFDERTANAICMACFHSSSRIMIAVLSFLLDYEKIENDDEDSDDLSSEDEMTQNPHVVISKETVYKAHHKGTAASKKKKKAKLQRAIRSMKRQQRLSSESSNCSYYSPLYHLKDAQGFVEKLFSRLQTCNERFEVKMMMLKVIARTVGLHRLILLNFYPFLQRYVQPHQKDITNLLAAAVQACHDMVPPDAVEPLFKQIVNQFVHDRSRPEAIAVGLNVIREICLRMPLLMTEDLLQDLVLYKKSHEKAVSAAARSLITLFREVCPSLLVKKDRGRPMDPKAKPKSYGEVNVLSNVPDIELLEQDDDIGGSEDDESGDEAVSISSDDGNEDNDDEESQYTANDGSEDEDVLDEEGDENDSVDEYESDIDDANEDDSDDEDKGDTEELETEEDDYTEEVSGSSKAGDSAGDGGNEDQKTKASKRKLSDFEGQLIAADTSLRALKRLAEAKTSHASSDSVDGILSDEHFQRIKKLKAKKEAKTALAQQGFKIPSSDQLSFKRVDPSKLEAHVRLRLSKEERLALVKAGREDRGQYQARTAIKQKKTGGLSNRQKDHKKYMPLAAKKAKAQRSRQEKNKKKSRSGKQFRGKKAWKQ